METRILTNREIMRMPEGTKIRVKADVDCHPKYKEGGILSFDDDCESGEKPFGISIQGFGYCNSFKAAEYELI